MFPYDDRRWRDVLAFLERQRRPGEAILGPTEFVQAIGEAYGYRAAKAVGSARFVFVVVHKGQIDELLPAHVAEFRRRLVPVYGNRLFVVLGPPDRGEGVNERHLAALDAMPPPPRRLDARGRTVAIVTTHERADALARSLPQVTRLGVETLVVDDGSRPEVAERVARLCAEHGARRLRLEDNRGLPTALNAGLAWGLADPAVAWLSVFQDDVDVHPETLVRLARVQDPISRPILSGRVDPLHPTFGTVLVDGLETVRARSTPGVHLHAHRDYWAAVMPIPTPYLGAPSADGGRPGQGADEDFWVTCWSPESIVKRGGYVTCVPGLVRTFSHEACDSTWTPAPGAIDPPLARGA